MAWNGILKILEIQQFNRLGNLIWQDKNLRNILHLEGEEFILRAAFTGGQVSTIIPENYYIGLDNRSIVDFDDTLDDLLGEPQSGGYERQEISSSGDFSISTADSHIIASSPIVSFRAPSATWGPVRNLFFTTTADNSGVLISTVALPSAITVDFGDTVTMRIGLTLKEC